MEERKKELYIPTNIPESRANDFFPGFGAKEMSILGINFVIGVIVAVMIYVFTKLILAAAITMAGIGALTILIVRRDRYDECLIDQLMILRKFSKAQKVYEYDYYNIYERREADE